MSITVRIQFVYQGNEGKRKKVEKEPENVKSEFVKIYRFY